MKLDIPLIRLTENKNQDFQLEGEGKLGLILVCNKADLLDGGKEKALEIAKAVGYDFPKDLAILSTDAASLNLSEALESISYKSVISFHFSAEALGLPAHLVEYHPYVFEQMTLVLSDAIQNIKNDNDKKKKLWNAVKTLKPTA